MTGHGAGAKVFRGERRGDSRLQKEEGSSDTLRAAGFALSSVAGREPPPLSRCHMSTWPDHGPLLSDRLGVSHPHGKQSHRRQWKWTVGGTCVVDRRSLVQFQRRTPHSRSLL